MGINCQEFKKDCDEELVKLYSNENFCSDIRELVYSSIKDFYTDDSVKDMVKKGLFAEEIAKIFNKWKKEKAQARAI